MSTNEPEFEFGSGRGKISLKGRDAIRAGGWTIRALLVARALRILLPALAISVAILLWRP
jgi:hypothetical protein